MNYRRFFIVTLIVTLGFVSLLPIFNLRTDYYRVLSEDYHYAYPGYADNKVYLKTKWLLDEHDKFDAIVFGSSRVIGGFSDRIMPDNWANFGIPGGLPKEFAHSLQVLVDHGIKPKRVMVGLDDFDIYNFRNNRNDYRYRLYPRDWRDRLHLWYFYAFGQLVGDSKRILIGKVKLVENPNISRNSQGITLDNERFAERDFEIKTMDAWSKGIEKAPAQVERALADINAIVKICEEHGIALDIFMTPRHYKILYARNFDHMAQFRAALANSFDYWDFTNLQAGYWKDNRYWKETSHYSDELGAKVFARMNNASDEHLLGQYVTRDNIGSLIATMSQTLLQEMPHILSEDNNTFIHDSYLQGPWQPVTNSLRPIAALDQFAVLRVQLEVDPSVNTIQWFCGGKRQSTLYLKAGFNERYLPWFGDCNSGNAELVVNDATAARVLTMAINPVKAFDSGAL